MNLEGLFRGKTIHTKGISPHVNTTKKDSILASVTSLISTIVLKKNQARGIERQQKNTYPDEKHEKF
jgi:hypothetical protein